VTAAETGTDCVRCFVSNRRLSLAAAARPMIQRDLGRQNLYGNRRMNHVSAISGYIHFAYFVGKEILMGSSQRQPNMSACLHLNCSYGIYSMRKHTKSARGQWYLQLIPKNTGLAVWGSVRVQVLLYHARWILYSCVSDILAMPGFHCA
jgi:hypothetical protein